MIEEDRKPLVFQHMKLPSGSNKSKGGNKIPLFCIAEHDRCLVGACKDFIAKLTCHIAIQLHTHTRCRCAGEREKSDETAHHGP